MYKTTPETPVLSPEYLVQFQYRKTGPRSIWPVGRSIWPLSRNISGRPGYSGQNPGYSGPKSRNEFRTIKTLSQIEEIGRRGEGPVWPPTRAGQTSLAWHKSPGAGLTALWCRSDRLSLAQKPCCRSDRLMIQVRPPYPAKQRQTTHSSFEPSETNSGTSEKHGNKPISPITSKIELLKSSDLRRSKQPLRLLGSNPLRHKV